METGHRDLRKQLAVAVRSIQWSYSIFWSISPSHPGVLEWSEGYYNGDIKTRKTIEAVEWDIDQMSLKRSDQLRELYESLLVGETNPQARRPSAALSPEDLSDTEWYYLVCMSFVFNLGQGLPTSSLESGKPIWLCNAHKADSRVFSRSLLAKSASVQTVVCFPFLGGVLELGTTDLVSEDHSLIKFVEASVLRSTDCPPLSDIPNSVIPCDNEAIHIHDNSITPIVQVEETKSMTEGELIADDDDEPSNCICASISFSDCISHNLANLEDPISLSMIEMVDEAHHQAEEDSCLMRMESDIYGQAADGLHYRNVLGSIFKTNHDLSWQPSARGRNKQSCFVTWKKGSVGAHHSSSYGNSQRTLKKVLFGVHHRIHGAASSQRTDTICIPESNHVIAERRRKEKVNDRFCALKLLIPSIDKGDKVSILDDTIKYMKELERRVEELEACQDSTGGGTKPHDAGERTSEDCRNSKGGVKRKAGEADDEEGVLENSLVSLRDSATKTNLSISLIQKDITIEITCPWKECLLLEIIDALTNLRLDTHSVQSSTTDGVLSLTIKAKMKGAGGLSARVIREVLQRVLIRSG